MKMKNDTETALEYKEAGNLFYRTKEYIKAISMYKKGLSYDESNSILYYNIATCHLGLKNLDQSIIYTTKALKINPNYIKSLILRGRAKITVGQNKSNLEYIEEGLKDLLNGHQIVLQTGDNRTLYQIRGFLTKGRKIKYYLNKEIEYNENQNFLVYMDTFLTKEAALEHTTLREIMDKLKESTKIREKSIKEVPDHLLCRIMYDPLLEPVINSEGFTYNKTALKAHFGKNGQFDPVSRKNIYGNPLYFNRAIWKGTIDFLEENPWAYDTLEPNEDYTKIDLFQ